MEKVKEILSSLERNKGKITRVFIFCAIIKFFITAIYSISSDTTLRKQLETTVTIYCLLILGIIFLHEFCNCLLPKPIEDNFKMITHFSGKGFIFILISILFMNPLLGNQQNYSGYMLLCVGILSVLADLKFDFNKTKIQELIANERLPPHIKQEDLESQKNQMTLNSENLDTQEVKIQVTQAEKPKADNNPYEIPEDF